jgi:hypothetical protein
LAHLELGVLLADHIELALAADNLAILAALFDGCLDFHGIGILFVSEGYSSFGQIIR